MTDDVKAAVERFHTWEFDGLDARDHATLLAHLDGEPARTAAAVAAAREEQREACARHIREEFLADLDIDADSACLNAPLDATPLSDRLEELERQVANAVAELEREVVKSNHRALELQYILDDATKRAETAERIIRYETEGLR